MDSKLSISPGKRWVVAGRTGSGKTTLAYHVVKNSPGVWIALDTKRDPFFKRFRKHLPELENPSKIFRWWRPYQKVVVVGGSSDAAANDEWIEELFLSYDTVGLWIDELYMVTPPAMQGQGLARWLTQGRALKDSFIGLTQRPAWVSRFCFSEADTVIGFNLTLDDDRKRMLDMTGNSAYRKSLEPHVFVRTDQTTGESRTEILRM